ncbi:MAG: GCG_CRPN prefix-to-repeats domain-containing protein [Thiohalocapsa sp.]
MRITGFALGGALALAASAASAAPIAAPAPAQQPNIINVAYGCGWGFHPNRWGRCLPNRRHYRGHAYWHRHYRPYAYWRHHHYRPYAYWRPYWRGYYGSSYGPSPSDHVANQLNWREMHRIYGY